MGNKLPDPKCCGQDYDMEIDGERNLCRVYCPNCGLSTGWMRDPQSAIGLWHIICNDKAVLRALGQK